MTKKERELQRLKALVDAAIEYELIYTAPEIVYEGFAPLKEHFMHLQQKADEYFEKGKLQQLKRLFDKCTDRLKFRADLKFVAFITEKSGVDFDPFAGLGDAINCILTKGIIQNKKEKELVNLQLDIYRLNDPDSKQVALLNELIIHYYEKKPLKRSKSWSKVVKKEIVGNLEKTSYVSGTGPEPKIYDDERIQSPDDKRALSITQHSIDGKTGVTMIHVILARSSLPIYQLNELNSNIKAYWKDNNTVVVQTPDNLNAVVQYNTVQSFDDVIKIEYRTN